MLKKGKGGNRSIGKRCLNVITKNERWRQGSQTWRTEARPSWIDPEQQEKRQSTKREETVGKQKKRTRPRKGRKRKGKTSRKLAPPPLHTAEVQVHNLGGEDNYVAKIEMEPQLSPEVTKTRKLYIEKSLLKALPAYLEFHPRRGDKKFRGNPP